MNAKRSLAVREVLPPDAVLSHHLFKQKSLVVRQITGAGVVVVRVLGVNERDDFEAAFVDIEVDVSLLKIGRIGLPA